MYFPIITDNNVNSFEMNCMSVIAALFNWIVDYIFFLYFVALNKSNFQMVVWFTLSAEKKTMETKLEN